MAQSLLSPKFQYWVKQLSRFVSVQIVVQALGFACGILLVRTLPKEEYAYFTLANSMQGAMNVLANSGISSGVSAIGGKVWQDPYRFGQLVNTALKFRKYLAIAAVGVVTPILLWLLIKNGASTGYAALLAFGILLELHFYLTTNVLIFALRFTSQVKRIQDLELIFSGTRILLLAGAYFTFINAAVAVFVSTFASGIKNAFLGNWVKSTIDKSAPTKEEDEKEISRLIKNQAPNTIFYCINGQLTIWLISIFGSTENIAEVGALSRLSVIFAIASSVMLNIVLPDFSRCQEYSNLVKKYWTIITGYLLFSIVIITLSIFLKEQFVSILGKQYISLKSEVVLMVISSVVIANTRMLWTINTSKGWIDSAWLFVPTLITAKILCLLVLDISTVRGVLLFSTLSTLPATAINLFMNYKGFRKIYSN